MRHLATGALALVAAACADAESSLALTPQGELDFPADRIRRDLVAEVATADRYLGSTLTVDFGTAAEHKYTQGGRGTGWGAQRQTRKRSSTFATGSVSRLLVPCEEVRDLELRLWLRPAGAARIDAFWNGHRVGAIEPVAADFRPYALTLPAASTRVGGADEVHLGFLDPVGIDVLLRAESATI